MTTSKSRTFLAGVYYKGAARRWALVHRPRRQPSRIFYEHVRGDAIGALAFEDHHEIDDTRAPVLASPAANDIYTNLADFFHTCARLTGLKQATPCYSPDRSIATGLLLESGDGHRQVVGQVRLDLLGNAIPITDETDEMILVFDVNAGRYPYVAQVVTEPSEVRLDAFAHMSVRARGRIDWFWSRGQCFIVYEGQQSPRTS